jgi:hypothetical protein
LFKFDANYGIVRRKQKDLKNFDNIQNLTFDFELKTSNLTPEQIADMQDVTTAFVKQVEKPKTYKKDTHKDKSKFIINW